MMSEHRRTFIVATIVWIPLFGVPLWMLLDRDPPFVVTNGRIDPQNPTANSSIEITWDIKPQRSCQPSSAAKVTRTIIDSKGIRHTYAAVPAIYGTSAQNEPDEIRRPVPLPENITGQAKYTSIACYSCNPLQWLWPICIQLPEIPFEIAPAKDGT